MASLFGLMLETMPISAAVQALKEKYGREFFDLSAQEVKERITLLENDASFDVDLPSLNPDLDKESQPLWAFSHGGTEPQAVRAIYCRVRDADYVGHQVATRVQWGFAEEGGAFQQSIRVTFKAGGQVLLPLSKDYVFWKFQVRGGNIRDDQTALWRLESQLDSSLVVIFAYDIDPVTKEIKKFSSDTISNPTLREEVRRVESEIKKLLPSVPQGQGGAEGSDGGTNPPPPDYDEPAAQPPPANTAPKGSESDSIPSSTYAPDMHEPWGTTMLKGDFWQPANETGPAGAVPTSAGVSGQVGGQMEVATEPARLLVAFTFTTCCERADFEPGAIVGFAKLFPHLLVSSTVHLEKLEASILMERPPRLLKWEESDRNMEASCCKPGFDGWTPEFKSLLVTDGNKYPNPALPEPLPYWSNMFDYYMVDPYQALGARWIHVVRTDRPTIRTSARPVVTRNVVMGPSEVLVTKLPRQGEFDNIHVAPRLVLRKVDGIENRDEATWHLDNIGNPVFGVEDVTPVTDRKKWRFDEIVMAPFCAHDCFHMHWRWPEHAKAKWSLGWSATRPYEERGAPMVPHGQDVWLSFKNDYAFSYHIRAHNPVHFTGWVPLMHHGLGHAVSIEATIRSAAAMVSARTFANFHLRHGEEVITPLESTAAYYWTARYSVSFKNDDPHPVERLLIASREDLDEARDL